MKILYLKLDFQISFLVASKYLKENLHTAEVKSECLFQAQRMGNEMHGGKVWTLLSQKSRISYFLTPYVTPRVFPGSMSLGN